MKPRRFRFEPWKRGPAEIIRFPKPPLRAIHIVRDPADGFTTATPLGLPGHFSTHSSYSFDLVLRTASDPQRRQGVPIIVGAK